MVIFQDFIRMQTERDNIIKEYQTKSESYRDKIQSLEQVWENQVVFLKFFLFFCYMKP